MDKRTSLILYHLLNADGPITSEELGTKMALSSRTIRNEMSVAKECACQCGMQIISKRNYGYEIQIVDEVLYQKFIEAFKVRFSLVTHFNSYTDARFLFIIRKLVGSGSYVNLDDLAEEMYLSRSVITAQKKNVVDFLESYHLKVKTKSGEGLLVTGNELDYRRVIVNLCHIIFNQYKTETEVEEFNRWILVEESRRQKIRHILLDCLCLYKCSITDIGTQWLAMYLVVSQTRFLAGHLLQEIPYVWLNKTKEYQIAADVLKICQKEYPDYLYDENEVSGLTVFLLAMHDNHDENKLCNTHKTLLDVIEKKSGDIQTYLVKAIGKDIEDNLWLWKDIRCNVAGMERKMELGVYGGKEIGAFSDDRLIQSRPFCMELGRGLFLQCFPEVSKNFEKTDFYLFANMIFKILYERDFRFKKRNIFVVSGVGINMAEMIVEKIKKCIPHYINHIHCGALYEIRGTGKEIWDAIVFDYSGNENYNFTFYGLPSCDVHAVSGYDFVKELRPLIPCFYDLDSLLSQAGCIHVVQDFKFYGMRRLAQFIGFTYGRKKSCQHELEKWILEKNHLERYVPYKKILFVYIEYEFTGENFLDIYQVSRNANENAEVRWVVLYSGIFAFSEQAKAMDNVIHQMVQEKQIERFLEEEPRELLKEFLAKTIEFV